MTERVIGILNVYNCYPTFLVFLVLLFNYNIIGKITEMVKIEENEFIKCNISYYNHIDEKVL